MTITQRQRSVVYALFDEAPVVFTCQVNATFSTHDMMAVIPYSTVVSGTYTDVAPGMTVLVGTAAGLNDVGITFVRKAPTATEFYVGETSEIAWANGLYLTVMEEFAIWAEHLRIKGNNTVYMKYDVAYSNQHTNMKPIPNIGADRVLHLEGASVSTIFDAAGSISLAGTISGHAWACEGADSIVTDGSTATLTFLAAGRYILKYTATTDLGASSDTYRVIWVYTDVTDTTVKISQVTVGSLAGLIENGGWEFEVAVPDDGSGAALWMRERTKVVLFAEEWEEDGATPVSYGDVPGSENIIAIGWAHQESITFDAEGGETRFSASGTAAWLQRVYSFIPVGFQKKTTLNWIRFTELTVDKALWNLVMWRSTISNCVDTRLTGDTKLATELSAPSGTLWEQINILANDSILATACCTRYGALVVEVEAVLTPEDERDVIPVKGAISADNFEGIEITKELAAATSQVVLSGVALVGDKGKALFSLSRGHIPTHYGVPKTMQKLLLATQAQANDLAAMLLEKDNPPFRALITGIWNHDRTVDLCPRQFVNLTLDSADNGRGFEYNGHVITRSIGMSYEDGSWSSEWEVEPETFPVLSVKGDVPGSDDGSIPWNPPSLPPEPVPPVVPPPSEGPGEEITVVGKIGILFQSGTANGVWMLDTQTDTTTWKHVTQSGWSAAELAAITYFELDPTQNVFLASEKKIWSQKLAEASSRNVIADETTFEALYPNRLATFYYGIHAAGMKPAANGFCCLVGLSYTGLSGGYRHGLHVFDGSRMKQTFYQEDQSGKTGITPAAYAPGGRIVFSNDVAYVQLATSHVDNPPGRLAFMNTDLSGYHATPIALDFGGSVWNRGFYPAVAKDADIVYAWSNATKKPFKISQAGTVVEALAEIYEGVAEKQCRMACDPSGMYVWMVTFAATFIHSSDYGGIFTSILNLPSLGYDGLPSSNMNNGMVINLGDGERWLVVYTATVKVSLGVNVDNYVHVFYTPDNGASWQNFAGGFHTDPNDPGPGIPKVVRYV